MTCSQKAPKIALKAVRSWRAVVAKSLPPRAAIHGQKERAAMILGATEDRA